MKQILLVVDVQPHFSPPDWLVDGAQSLARGMGSVATVELHDEEKVPFQKQLGWVPGRDEKSLVETDVTFIKHGYLPPQEMLDHLRKINPDRVLVCGIQTDTCLLAAGFALFDAGMQPTLLASLTRGSSIDRTGELGTRLWRHHFGHVIEDHMSVLEA